MLEANGTRLLLDCGPGVLGRLRENELWPRVDGIAITHFHLDHWGDLVPWVWGTFYLATNGPLPKPALWVQPGGAEFLTGLGERLGFPDMFERTFELSEYQPDTPFQRRATHGHPDPRAPLHPPDLRLPGRRRRARARVLGRLRALGGAGQGRTRRRPVRLRSDAATRRARRRAAWAPLARRGRRRLRGLGSEAAPGDAPSLRAGDSREYELAYDGLELDV